MSTGGWGGQQAPAGWYPDPASGATRWWDGSAWGAFAPQPPPDPFATPSPYAASPYGYQPYGYVGGYAPARPGTNGLAIASLVCGIAFVCGVTAPAAVVLGHVALAQIKRTGEGGRGLAIAGLVLGYLALAFWLLVIVVGVVNGSSTTSSG